MMQDGGEILEEKFTLAMVLMAASIFLLQRRNYFSNTSSLEALYCVIKIQFYFSSGID
jgi:hypothetical protein